MKQYETLAGRRFSLAELTAEERAFLDELLALYRARPEWSEFAREWVRRGRAGPWRGRRVPVGSPLYRICQDLEARLGVAEGRVAPPDYRDQLASLIEERFGSRYAFCQATGIDQGNLSKVLAGHRHLSPETLQRALEALGVVLRLVDRATAVAGGEPLVTGSAAAAG